MNKRKLKIYFQTKTDFLDDFLPKGSLCIVHVIELHNTIVPFGISKMYHINAWFIYEHVN